jgi:ribulose kinase
MFISTEEKLRISSELSLVTSQISALIAAAAKLEKRVADLEKKPVKVKKPKKVLTPEQKAKQRAYQTEYKRRQKAKLAQLIQGTPNVSA